ncbi:MAG: carboxypeptidase regulatory-like domain-containing protein [Edaphobacter sp.]|uniref:TonB-dependent receptor n=1 Tax=Edaphobacter sp. TaxID=1934404 RepID=UPI0023A42F7D|nr:carboxypeptidase regulatory-like domain-containing protein [Edaphobacter sp.]MDE1177904.1 carboxypeptidase regulatory-like domain-containing protein [Edaphobacter sp.]
MFNHFTRRRGHRLAALFVFFGLFVFLAGPLSAQQGTGNIIGTVKDSTGATVTGATVDIENLDTQNKFTLTTNDAGFYNSPPLVLGSNYRVTVSRPGFQTSVTTGIPVTVGSRVETDVQLSVGGATETVQVDASQAVLDTTSATLGAVVGEKSIQELPLNGRNTIALTTLTPGVRINTTVAQSGFANRGTNLSAISINGSPTGSNSYILDGQSNLSTTTGEIAVNPNTDSIQEFKVQSGSFSAQYGFTLGGVVNLVSRSGTNNFHGSIYEFLRNDVFNARNYFARPPLTKPVLRYNQFGGAIGGPIVHNRAYFFANYEAYRFIQSNPQYLSVPTAAQRTGDFSGLADSNGNKIQLYNPYTTTINGNIATRQPYLNNQVTNLDPVALNYQNTFYPLPNVTPTNAFTNTNNFLFLNRGISNMYNALGRVDYRLSDKDTVFVRYAYYNNFTNGGTGGGTYYPDPTVANRYDTYIAKEILAGDTHTFSSTLINDLRLSVERQEFPFQAVSAGGNWPQQLGLPSNVPNFALPTVGNGLPASVQTIGLRTYTLPQITDTLTKVIQRHTLTMGTDLRYNIGGNLQRNTPSGNFSFAAGLTSDPSGAAAAPGFVNTGYSYASFLAGAVSTASITTNLGETDRAISTSFFLQDDWQPTDRLTLNLGLRWDYQQQPYEQNNGYSNFNPNLSSGGFQGIMQYANTGGVGRNFVPESFTDFGPRIGFAYKATADGKTVLRGGFGMYYPLMFNSIYTGQTNGFSSTNTSYNPSGNDTRLVAFQFKNGFPTNPLQPLGAAFGPLGFLGQSPGYQDPTRWKTPMSQQYTLSVQREIPYSIVVQATYVGNHGVHLPAGGYNMNSLDPKYFSLGRLALQASVPNPYAGQITGSLGAATITRAQSLLPYPYYSSVSVYNPHDANLMSHALQLSAQRQARNGLILLFGYTMSKTLEDSITSPLAYLNGLAANNGYQNVYNRHAEYSLDPSDVSQRATVSALYNLPFGRNQKFSSGNAWINRAIGGFQFNLIGVFQTGTPLNITGANAYSATRPNYVPGESASIKNPSTAKWFNTFAFQNPTDYTFGNVPRSLPRLRGPGTENFDFSIFKTTEITERWKIQLRAEAFNVLNHANFGLPNTSFSASANTVPAGGNNGIAAPCTITARDSFGTPTSGSGGCNTNGSFGAITSAADGRSLQLAAKLIF